MVSVELAHYQYHFLPQRWLSELYYRKWFKMFVPKKLGGLEMSLVQGLETLTHTASVHGSLGWILNLGAGAGYFCGSFSEQAAQKIYGSAKAVVAGNGQVSGEAHHVEGGYTLSGRWQNCSGAAHATAFTVNSLDVKEGKTKSFVLMPQEVLLQDQWSAFGLKPTSSYSLEVAQTFVPSEFMFEIGALKSFEDYPLYRIPFTIFARFCMIVTLIGIIDCFVNQIIDSRQVKMSRIKPQVIALKKLREIEEERILALAQQCWEQTQADCLEEDSFDNFLHKEVAQINTEAFMKVCEICHLAGLSVTSEAELVHWAFRDVMTACQHSLMK